MNKFRNFFSLFLLLESFNIIKSSLKFNIPSYRDKCFQQQIYLQGTLLVRYDLNGYQEYFKGTDEQELFKSIKIFIKNEKGQHIYETSLIGRKNKFAILLKEPQTYEICTRYYKPRNLRELPGFVVMSLKISNEYQYHLSQELGQNILRGEVDHFWKRIWVLKSDMKPTIESSQNEIKEEDKTAKSLISSAETYYKLSVIQLVIIIVITIYTIVSYQDFFKKKSII